MTVVSVKRAVIHLISKYVLWDYRKDCALPSAVGKEAVGGGMLPPPHPILLPFTESYVPFCTIYPF